MISTNRLFRNPARETLVPLTPSTKERLVAARATPTNTPVLKVSQLKRPRRGRQISPMSSVASEKRRNRKVTGGMSRKPTLLKMKLPPQNSVVRIRKKVALEERRSSEGLFCIAY